MLKQREITDFNLGRKTWIACLGGLILFRSASRFSLNARRSRRDFLPCTEIMVTIMKKKTSMRKELMVEP